MIVYHAKEFEDSEPRAHPWSTAISNQEQKYVDFKASPKSIRTALEDLIPFENEKFTQKFYTLLEWLNSPKCSFESNDCSFLGPHANDTDYQFNYKLKCSGRLMILFRDIEENTQSPSIEWLLKSLNSSLRLVKPGFKAGAIGLSEMKTVYMQLDDRPKMGGLGKQVMFSMFAYGKNKNKCFDNMETVMDCLDSAIRSVDKKVNSGELRNMYDSAH